MQQPARIIRLCIVIAIACMAAGYGLAKLLIPHGATSISSVGLTTKLEKMTDLVLLRVNVSDILQLVRTNGFWDNAEGLWIIKGDALISVDMSKLHVDHSDDVGRKVLITLPKPRVLSYRIEHAKSRCYQFKEGFFTPREIGFEAHQQAMLEGQQLICFAAGQSENIELAQRRAEYLIHDLCDALLWSVQIHWTDGAMTNAPTLKG